MSPRGTGPLSGAGALLQVKAALLARAKQRAVPVPAVLPRCERRTLGGFASSNPPAILSCLVEWQSRGEGRDVSS